MADRVPLDFAHQDVVLFSFEVDLDKLRAATVAQYAFELGDLDLRVLRCAFTSVDDDGDIPLRAQALYFAAGQAAGASGQC